MQIKSHNVRVRNKLFKKFHGEHQRDDDAKTPTHGVVHSVHARTSSDLVCAEGAGDAQAMHRQNVGAYGIRPNERKGF